MLGVNDVRPADHILPALRWAIFAAIFAFAILSGYAVFVLIVQNDIHIANKTVLSPYSKQTENAIETLAELHAMENQGCSSDHITEMRRNALLPDGIHIVMQLNDSRIACTSFPNPLFQPIELGEPDIETDALTNLRIWLNQPLDSFGFPGEHATIAGQGNYAVASRMESSIAKSADWLEQDLVFRKDHVTFLSRDGQREVFNTFGYDNFDRLLRIKSHFGHIDCETLGLICVIANPRPAALVEYWSWLIGILALLVVFSSLWVMAMLDRFIRHHWSFEHRFMRAMTQRIECVYQPVVDVENGEVVACEVLARWRDVDGRLVEPSDFLPIVEKNDLTLAFTRSVVDRAFRELAPILSAIGPLQINFNVFPRDYSVDRLADVLIERDDIPDSATIAVEIIEVERADFEAQKREISHFRERGIKTYIDDFGSGYSNLSALAALSVAGIKLDKSFGMAPPESLEAQMLPIVLDLIASANHTIIVEGIEYRSRLEEVRRYGNTHLMQDYFFTRPLPADAFLAWLRDFDLQTLYQSPPGQREAAPGDDMRAP